MTTRIAGGLDLHAPGVFPTPIGGERPKHIRAFIVAVVSGCIVPPWRDLKATHSILNRGIRP